jgi:hypothetical protein
VNRARTAGSDAGRRRGHVHRDHPPAQGQRERPQGGRPNKGPYILDAVATLADILDRMTGHHDKKNSLLRPLRSWRPFRPEQIEKLTPSKQQAPELSPLRGLLLSLSYRQINRYQGT